MTVGMLTLVAMTLSLGGIALWERRPDKTRALGVIASLAAACVLVLVVASAYVEEPMDLKLSDLGHMVAMRQAESKNVPEDLSGCVLVYFRPGCPDCEAVWPDLKATLAESGLERVYFVNTRSARGKALLEKYPVQEVPSGAYVARRGNNTPSFHELLYKYAADGEVVFREEGIDALYSYQVRNW